MFNSEQHLYGFMFEPFRIRQELTIVQFCIFLTDDLLGQFPLVAEGEVP